MRVMAQSAGRKPEYDYRWIEDRAGGPVVMDRDPLDQYHFRELLDAESESLVIARHGQDLLLLLAGLPARGDGDVGSSESRADFRGRRIRNSVLWMASVSDEASLRALAARALRSWNGVAADVHGCIRDTPDQPMGLHIDFGAIAKLPMAAGMCSGHQLDLKELTAKDSSERREQLAVELESHALPRRQGVLVVVTKHKSLHELPPGSYWRGLALSVPNDEWTEKKKSTQPRRLVLLASILAITATLYGLKSLNPLEQSQNGLKERSLRSQSAGTIDTAPMATSFEVIDLEKAESDKSRLRTYPQWQQSGVVAFDAARTPQGLLLTIRFDRPLTTRETIRVVWSGAHADIEQERPAADTLRLRIRKGSGNGPEETSWLRLKNARTGVGDAAREPVIEIRWRDAIAVSTDPPIKADVKGDSHQDW